MTKRHSPGRNAKGARASDIRRDSRKPTRTQRTRHIYEEDEDSFDVPDTVLGSGDK